MYQCGGVFSRRNTISDAIRKAMRSAGVPGTMYIWRAYFKIQLLPAQGKKGLVPEYVEFWMGHFNGIQSTYSFDKDLPLEVMQDIVEQYRTIAAQFLETRPSREPTTAPAVSPSRSCIASASPTTTSPTSTSKTPTTKPYRTSSNNDSKKPLWLLSLVSLLTLQPLPPLALLRRHVRHNRPWYASKRSGPT